MWDWCGGRRLQCHLFNEFAGIFDAKTREASAPAGGTKSHIDPAESPTRARLPYSDGGDCFLGSNKLQALLPPAAAAVYYCQTLAMDPPCGLKALPRPFLIQVLLISTPHRALSSNALLSKYLASSWSNWRLCKTLTEKRYYCWEGLHRPDICCERREQRACKILGWV